MTRRVGQGDGGLALLHDDAARPARPAQIHVQLLRSRSQTGLVHSVFRDIRPLHASPKQTAGFFAHT